MSTDNLPTGWTCVKFGDVVRNCNDNSRDLDADGLDRVVGLDHLDPGSLRLVRWDDLADLPDGTTFRRKFRPGQVLFGKRRAYQRKVAVADFEGVCSGDILVFEPVDKRMLSEFLPYVVQSDGFYDHALGTSAGSLSPRTKWAELAKYEFALPPIDEQRYLAAVLSASQRCAVALERLVEATRSARSLELRSALGRGGSGWESRCLGEIADFQNGYPFKPSELGAEGTPVIRIKQLLDVDEPTDKSLVDVPPHCRLADGDIVFSWSATLAVRRWDRGPALLNQHLFRVIEKSDVDRNWLALILEDSLDALAAKSHGTTMKHITKAALLPHEVLVPPIETQVEIASIAASYDELIASACVHLRDARSLQYVLREQLTRGEHVQ